MGQVEEEIIMPTQDDRLRKEYEREKAQYEKYQRERAAYDAQQAALAKAQQPEEAAKEQPITPMGNVVGMTRVAADALMGGTYPKAVGALTGMLGGDGKAEAKKLASYIAEYKARQPSKSSIATTVGDVLPYVTPATRVLGSAMGGIPKVAKAAEATGAAYKMAQKVPLLGKLLPSSAKTAAEIAAIEGTRGAVSADSTTSPVQNALERVGKGLAFGKAGEVVGTYAAGKLGPTLGSLGAQAQKEMAEAGKLINAYREKATVTLSPALANLYSRSKVLREAVDQTADALGLPATDPTVLAEAYSKMTSDATPVFRDQILKPFLKEIDNASSITLPNNVVKPYPLSPGIQAYAKAGSKMKGAEAGAATGKYLRTGTGNALESSPEMLVQKLSGPFATPEARQAAAQALISSIREGRSEIGGGVLKSILTAGRGVGDIAATASRLGGSPSFSQTMIQRTGTGLGASRGKK
jgi:hypothetical protein